MKIAIPSRARQIVRMSSKQLSRYKLVLFVVLIALVYGFILLTISSLSSAEPTEAMIEAQANPIKSAKVDTKVVQQLKQLQDNSVSVQTLFDEARDNPFQE